MCAVKTPVSYVTRAFCWHTSLLRGKTTRSRVHGCFHKTKRFSVILKKRPHKGCLHYGNLLINIKSQKNQWLRFYDFQQQKTCNCNQFFCQMVVLPSDGIHGTLPKSVEHGFLHLQACYERSWSKTVVAFVTCFQPCHWPRATPPRWPSTNPLCHVSPPPCEPRQLLAETSHVHAALQTSSATISGGS